MIAGHFTTALIPYELTREKTKAPFWIYLLASQFLDLLMLIFISFGFEKLEPTNFLEAAFSSMYSEMFLSHDIIPVLGWTALFGVIVLLVTKKSIIAIWCIILILLHEIFDLIVGFEHYVLGTKTKALGFNLYNNAPIVGLIVEAIICAVIIFWFCHRRSKKNTPTSPLLKWSLYGLLVGSTLATMLIANQSINSLLNF